MTVEVRKRWREGEDGVGEEKEEEVKSQEEERLP